MLIPLGLEIDALNYRNQADVVIKLDIEIFDDLRPRRLGGLGWLYQLFVRGITQSSDNARSNEAIAFGRIPPCHYALFPRRDSVGMMSVVKQGR